MKKFLRVAVIATLILFTIVLVSCDKTAEFSIRFIVDDCLKFVEREYRRGNKYDAIVMDPPSYGRGPNGEVWKFEKNLYVLIEACLKILSDKPIFFLINSYTTGISSIVLENILKTTILPLYPNGKVDAGEVGLPIKRDNSGNPVIDNNRTYSDNGYIPDWQFMEDYINSLPYSDRI